MKYYLKNRFFIRLVLLIVWFISPIRAQYSPEVIKGEFVERFTRFIEWPDTSANADTSEPFVVAIVGKCSFEKNLIEAFERRRVRDRKAIAKVLMPGEGIPPQCRVLFIAESERPRLTEILKSVQSRPILTVANARGFAGRGVLINLYEENGFIRFEVNLKTLDESGLRMSSKMLKHATIVD